MFKNFFQELSDELDQIKEPKDISNFIAMKREELLNTREEILKIMNTDITTLAISETISYAYNTLEFNAVTAMYDGKEFDIPQFSNRLVEAIQNPNTITIEKRGEGSIRVSINLRATAGELRDYANAISAVREILEEERENNHSRVYNKSPEWASHAWKEKFYRPAREGASVPPKKVKQLSKAGRWKLGRGGKPAHFTKDKTATYIAQYWRTIEMRIGHFESLAPFWQIVDQGTTSLDSDYGGYAYPVHPRTGFVDKTRKQILAEFQLRYREQKIKIEKLKVSLNNVNGALNYLNKIENELTTVNLENMQQLSIELVRAQLQKYNIGHLEMDVRNIANQIVEDYIQGIEGTRYRSTLGGGNAIEMRAKEIFAALRNR